MLVSIADHRLLVDPMLSDPGVLPGFKMFGGGRRRNPLVPLPASASDALASVTAVMLTHEHPDHFDAAALRWVKERRMPVWANAVDAGNLRRKGVDVHDLVDGALGMRVEVITSRHGSGLLGWMLGPVAGYYLSSPDEPSLYVVGDSVLTDSVTEAIERLQPDVVVMPAGAANMGLGGDILFSVDDVMMLAKLCRGHVVLNHLEALDHCPTTRRDLKARVAAERLGDRVHVPDDGEELTFERPTSAPAVPKVPSGGRPGVQKWLTAPFAGT